MSEGAPAAAASGRRTTLLIDRSEKVVAVGVATLLFLEHLAFGGGRREVGLIFAAAQGLALAAVVLLTAWGRRDFARPSGLLVPAVLFLLTCLAALWSLTPFAPGGPHPAWAYVSAAPAAAIDKSAVIVSVIQLGGLACMFLLGWLLGADDDRARYALTILIAGGGAYAVWAFAAHLIDPGVIYGIAPKLFHQNRLTGSFFSANTAGTFLGANLVLIACVLAGRAGGRHGSKVFRFEDFLRRRALYIAALAFTAASLVLTASRGAIAATTAALVVFWTWEALSRRWKLISPAGLGGMGLAVCLAALLTYGGDMLFDRILRVGQDAASRHELATVHWRAFLAAPWSGYGLGSFDAINNLIMTSQTYGLLSYVHAAHNVYLQWLEEAGVIGAAPMFLCVGWLLAMIVLGSRRRSRMTTWLRGITAAILVFLLHGTADFGLQIPSISAFLACLLGLGFGLSGRKGAWA